MARLKPWFHVVPPREDLREGRPLDASEFAVHLDQVREGKAPDDYRIPERFFERTYMTKNLTDLAAQVARRLSGERVETSAVFNMSTQFGGGKTHALTLLYHLAQAGPAANGWPGMRKVLDRARVARVPKASVAAFVGTEFDSMAGRGGTNGEPLRQTPWGEIAWQLGGAEAFARVAAHDEQRVAPGGDVIRAFLPEGPALILMDEVMNYVSRSRRSGLAAQFHSFVHSLSEEARGRDNLVLAVSIPASELEMNPEDQRDFEALKKLLDRVGKAMIMSAETESAEIIRRRLFEWHGVPEDGRRTAAAYAGWVLDHRHLVGDFDAATARERFLACYPFHPALLSVFERKWQSLPRFQKTRGVLRLLALWVSRAYVDGYRGVQKDPLIGLGTAPLEDPYFRAALFEQLGNSDLEAVVTTDIAGKKDAHALRLDREASDEVKRARLHQKAATVILFESNGGQSRTEATVPEVRLAVAEPELDVANVETALEALTESCYYLSADRNRYRFSLSPNLNKLLIDRRAGIGAPAIEERVKREIQTVFKAGPAGLERVFSPEASGEIPDRPALTLVILAPEHENGEARTRGMVEEMVRNHGGAGRTCKSALLFAAPDTAAALHDEARKLLACAEIAADEEMYRRLDEAQRRQLKAAQERAGRDLKEAVWRTYRYVLLLDRDNALKVTELTQPNSSMAHSLAELIVNRLRADDEIADGVGAHRLARYWPPGLAAWSTKAVRDAFYAAPALPRLLDPSVLRRTIADGVAQGLFAYAAKDAQDRFEPLYFNTALAESEIEFSDETFLLTTEEARRRTEPPRLARIELNQAAVRLQTGSATTFAVSCYDQHGASYPCPVVEWSAEGGAIDGTGRYIAEGGAGSYTVRARVGEIETSAMVSVLTAGEPLPPPRQPTGICWQGSVPPQKWMNFYTKVLSRFAATPGLALTVRFEVPAESTVSAAQMEETRTALRELGLREDFDP